MIVPEIAEAEKMLAEAERQNPGEWVSHNRVAGQCAKTIAENCDDLNPDTAYVLGLLHDIGRRFGACDLRHILLGYTYMAGLGFDDSARICLTHSFPYKDMEAYNGQNDCSDEESSFIRRYLESVAYTDYDLLIQLCDALSYPTGPVFLEKRLVDVVLRKGFNELTIPKWKAFFSLKEYFDGKTGCDIYSLLGVR